MDLGDLLKGDEKCSNYFDGLSNHIFISAIRLPPIPFPLLL